MKRRRPPASFLEQITLEFAAPAGARQPLRRIALRPHGGPDGRPGPLEQARSLEAQAMRWSYVLRNRSRWLDRGDARERRAAEAVQTLRDFGIGAAELAALAQARCVAVVMPYTQEAEGWAARLLPWEYLLARATRPLRDARAAGFTVLRELRRRPSEAPHWQPRHPQARLLWVDSAPAGLRAQGSFGAELTRLRRALPGLQIETLSDPSLASLQRRVAELRPDLVHLSGFDNLQGLQELAETLGPDGLVELQGQPRRLAELLAASRSVPDGLLLAGNAQAAALVSAAELAQALSAGGRHCSYFCGVNLANSAERTAALLVGEGAALAALGIQGALDNAVSDYLFELLYGQFGRAPWHAPQAFEQAWLRTRSEPRATRATGFALWCGAPLQPFLTEPGQPAAANAPSDEEPSLRYQPLAELNYSVLHNLQPLFSQFELLSGKAGAADWLQVDVHLHLGSEQARYRHRCHAGAPRLDLSERIRLPLTAPLLRSLPEAVNSTLEVRLSWNERPLSCDTHALRLLPLDQWRDNHRDGPWLPSFVLPRDPAVQQAVAQAQRYVRVLRDQPAAGFEGYQAVAQPADEEQLREVDLQVQALWATLLHDWQLGYINPPPSYSAGLDSQRLRTPSMVRQAGMGTCIDLALLFAACLELIDVYPVIFLLKGHALAGYWRHASFRTDFQTLSARPDAPTEEAAEPDSAIQTFAWQARGAGAHRELRQLIRARRLVPLETVRLTEHCGFFEAIEAGITALGPAEDFHSMLDIVSARGAHITPLPLGGSAP